MVTSSDVQEIVSKLSSDKAKAREVKPFHSLLSSPEYNRIGILFLFPFLSVLVTIESETWPFLIKLLTQCVSLEISTSKRRPPKLIFAKTLRTAIQRAEDTKFPGNVYPLLSVVKTLFSHILDVINNVPSFQSEYGIILRHLLLVKEYRFHMRKNVYSGLMVFYLEKVATTLTEKNNTQYSQKEEIFRSILALHSLLENPAGDFPDHLREDIVKGFVKIFSYIRNFRRDGTKDDKFGTLSSSQQHLVELAALVLYRACATTSRATSNEKRVKRESTAARLKEELVKGKWLWNVTFCYLIRNYYTRISKDLFIYWFEGICASFERIQLLLYELKTSVLVYHGSLKGVLAGNSCLLTLEACAFKCSPAGQHFPEVPLPPPYPSKEVATIFLSQALSLSILRT
ncbi:hypothetical protein GOBAR_AA19163 [Gossypium barbadense]|uniref:Telomere-length maintenance and DNA damage repair domain-containing protein n=1 Tax=Gossypium barbadense TaxID=3634 RepID=A0A2P5XDV2_GOSBA|nr:hypothetical protein GOBAR_AA19163 [Gossypium barbadense]